MSVTCSIYGKLPTGEEVQMFTLTNSKGMAVRVINYGATLIGVDVPDKDGKVDNVVLCLDGFDNYYKGHPCLGSTPGRYANRIAKGRFTLEGEEYKLACNNGANHLHGGNVGFDKRLWTARILIDTNDSAVEMTYVSPDGEEGYPGTLTAKVVYSVNEDNELKMDYFATTDKATVLNLTNHAYWNLSGISSGTDGAPLSVRNHLLRIHASNYLDVTDDAIPTGKLNPVFNTVMDFTEYRQVGKDVEKAQGGGYDHCYVLDGRMGLLRPAAEVYDPQSGRTMTVKTTQPGVQLYTANFLDGALSCNGVKYYKYAALCLETQNFPDAPNHPDFPPCELYPGEEFRQTTIHKFGIWEE